MSMSSRQANARRLKSLEERRNDYLSKRALIKNAFQNIHSTTSGSKRIVFESDDDAGTADEESYDVTSCGGWPAAGEVAATAKDTVALFDGDENDDDNDLLAEALDSFKVKPQFSSKAGQRLLRHQSRFNHDPRFRMDEKFLDDFQGAGEERTVFSKEEDEDSADPETEVGFEEEHMKQLFLARKILGEADVADGHSAAEITKKKKKQQHRFSGARFNPDDPSHYVYEVRHQTQDKTTNGEPNDANAETESDDVSDHNDVGLEEAAEDELLEPSFRSEPRQSTGSYKMKSEFVKMLKESQTDANANSSFSLLAAFGRPSAKNASESETSEPNQLSTETISSHPVKKYLSQKETDQDPVEEGGDTPANDVDHAASLRQRFFLSQDDQEVLSVVVNFPIKRHEAFKGWKQSKDHLIKFYKRRKRFSKRRLKNCPAE